MKVGPLYPDQGFVPLQVEPTDQKLDHKLDMTSFETWINGQKLTQLFCKPYSIFQHVHLRARVSLSSGV